MAVWTEFETRGEKVQAALWAGYTRNLGSNLSILNYSNTASGTESTVRGANLLSVLRVSPRLVFIRGNFNLATECELTRACYASQTNGTLNRNEFGVITDFYSVHNVRVLLSVIYKF